MSINIRARGGKRANYYIRPIAFGRAALIADEMRFTLGDKKLAILTDEVASVGTIDGQQVTRAGDKAVVAHELIVAAKLKINPSVATPDLGPARAFIYVGVGSTTQGNSAAVEAQLSLLRTYARRSKLIVAGEYCDDSPRATSTAYRPAWIAMLSDAQKLGVQIILVEGLDSISPSAAKLYQALINLSNSRIQLETPEGPMSLERASREWGERS